MIFGQKWVKILIVLSFQLKFDDVAVTVIDCIVLILSYFIPKLVNPNLYWGGGGLPEAVFCYSSKTVGARLLKLCGFYCYPITRHLVSFLVARDLSCCHGNLNPNRCLAKKRPKSESNFSRLLKIIKKIRF